MSATTGERLRKRSGAAVRRPDWAADATLAESFGASWQPASRRRSYSSARERAGMPAMTATTICCWSSRLNSRVTSAARYRRALTGPAGAKDILVWTPDEVAQWREVPNAFVTTAVQEGVVLYEVRCDLAHGWLLKARSDLNACRRMLETDGPYDTSCFHAQQVIDKSLKALLAFHRQPVPRTHDLEELQRLCSPLRALPTLARYDFVDERLQGAGWSYNLEF